MGAPATCTRAVSVAASLLLVATPSFARQPARQRGPLCFGSRPTVVGTAGDDVLRSSGGPAVIVGLGGDDVIKVDVSRDNKVCGGPGDDTIEAYDAEVAGGPGDDALTGRGLLAGGAGNDMIGDFEHAPANEAYSSYGVLRGGRGRDRIRGSSVLVGGRGDDRLTGGSSGDRFVPGAGDDSIHGVRNDLNPSGYGTPYDVVDLRDAPRPVEVDVGAGIATGWGRDSFSGVARVRGSRFGDRLFGSRRPRAAAGGRRGYDPAGLGRDSLDGWLGDDLIVGRSGGDYLRGGRGRDVLYGGRGGDAFPKGRGDDRMAGGPGADDMFGGPGDDEHAGGPGVDLISYWSVKRPARGIRADLAAGTIDGDGRDLVTGIERVRGTNRADVIFGSDADDYLHGEAGADELHGRGGDDYFNTGHKPYGHLYDGGPGRDTVDTSAWFTRTFADMRRGLLFMHRDLARRWDYRSWPFAPLPSGFRPGAKVDRVRSVEVLIGGDARDYFRGNGRDNILVGGGGPDRLYGRDGEDLLVGGAGQDRLRGETERDVLIGDCRKLRYNEWALYDYECSADRDDLGGGFGDDVLIGDCAPAKRARRCGPATRDLLVGGPDSDVRINCADREAQRHGRARRERQSDVYIGIEVRLACAWKRYLEVRPPRPREASSVGLSASHKNPF